MAALSYQQPDLILSKGGSAATDRQIRDLQRDLRQLGYLRSGIDGQFGDGTEHAVKALQHDLLNNNGSGNDGSAPVSIRAHNRGRVTAVTGAVDQALVGCISDLLDDAACPRLPSAPDPVAANRQVAAKIAAMPPTVVPIPFLLGILQQESGLKHFNQPAGDDEDVYITIGLDTNAPEKYIITSRGYGAGQYTLFHHPPTPAEVNDFMLDPVKNVQKAIAELKNKFDHFVNGASPDAQADDRLAEQGTGPLRTCKYTPGDARYMTDCKQCLLNAGTTDIQSGTTPVYVGATLTYEPTQYYGTASYPKVPVRANIGCDWPYAVRRYNGSGINSYHYQVRVLLHMLGR